MYNNFIQKLAWLDQRRDISIKSLVDGFNYDQRTQESTIDALNKIYTLFVNTPDHMR